MEPVVSSTKQTSIRGAPAAAAGLSAWTAAADGAAAAARSSARTRRV